MIEITRIGEAQKNDVNLPNEPFSLFGRMIPSYVNKKWDYSTENFETASQMCFPDENYHYNEMTENSVFIGAYDDDRCIGLAILQQAFFKYIYLYDLKVNQEYRRRGIAKKTDRGSKKGCR